MAPDYEQFKDKAQRLLGNVLNVYSPFIPLEYVLITYRVLGNKATCPHSLAPQFFAVASSSLANLFPAFNRRRKIRENGGLRTVYGGAI